jgi:TIR domain
MLTPVKVFISWSGSRSKSVAKALADWIPNVVQGTDCFYSDESIDAGQRWNDEITKWLAVTDFGIVCVTPENTEARWLNFEAGALAKKLDDTTRLVPVTLGFSPGALEFPLRQFNGVGADGTGIKKLVQSLVNTSGSKINVDMTFELWWPKLDAALQAIPAPAEDVAVPEPPDPAELLPEILSVVRKIERQQESSSLDDLLFGIGTEARAEQLRRRARLASIKRHFRDEPLDDQEYEEYLAKKHRDEERQAEAEAEATAAAYWAAEAMIDAARESADEDGEH